MLREIQNYTAKILIQWAIYDPIRTLDSSRMSAYESLRSQSPAPTDPTRSRESLELEDRDRQGGEEDHERLLPDDASGMNTEIDPWALACLLAQHASR